MKAVQQRGAVLLMALMVLAVVASLSAYTLKHLQRSVSLLSYRQDDASVRQQLLGGEAWASAWLTRHKDELSLGNEPDLDLPWYLVSQEFELDEPHGRIQIDVVERQSCINLNLLHDPVQAPLVEQRLTRLSNALSLETSWVPIVKDWLDRDQNLTQASSHEDEYYLGLTPAFRSADNLLVDASELSLLPVAEGTFARLAPYICWRPSGAQININRLNEPLIAAYLPTLDESQTSALLARLASSGFDSVNRFLAWPEFADESLTASEWRMDSRYVDVYVTLKTGQNTRFLHSRLRLLDDGRVVAFARAFAPFDVLSKALIQRDSETTRR